MGERVWAQNPSNGVRRQAAAGRDGLSGIVLIRCDVSQSTALSESLFTRLGVSLDSLEQLCRRWRIAELALFGSVLRADFRPDSDVDVLVTFAPDAAFSAFDVLELQEEMERLFGRPVDLVEARAIRNPFRRRDIFATRHVVYAAA